MMSSRYFLLPGAVVLLMAGSGSLHAQTPPPETTLRAETRLVLVDAVVTDKKGKAARDLTQNNFKLWEDGKEQKITGFSLESAGVSPERSKKHYIAMFFDTTTSGQTGLAIYRQESMRFVDGFATPGSLHGGYPLQFRQRNSGSAELHREQRSVEKGARDRIGHIRRNADAGGHRSVEDRANGLLRSYHCSGSCLPQYAGRTA